MGSFKENAGWLVPGLVSIGTLGGTTLDAEFGSLDSITVGIEPNGDTALSSGVLAVGTTVTSISQPVLQAGPFWQDSSGDWHIGDDVPYERVEQRAQQVFEAYRGKPHDTLHYPAIIAESAEAFDAVRTLAGDSYETLARNVDVLGVALKDR